MLKQFPGQPYTLYARLRYALALVDAGQAEGALAVVGPVLADAAWAGRGHYARGRAREAEHRTDGAIEDYRAAAGTADSSWFRGQAYAALGRLYAEKREFRLANECLQAALDVSPYRQDRLHLELAQCRNLCEAGDWVTAAGKANNLAMEVQNEKWRYPQTATTQTVKECDDVLDRCEAALSARDSGAPAAADHDRTTAPAQEGDVR